MRQLHPWKAPNKHSMPGMGEDAQRKQNKVLNIDSQASSLNFGQMEDIKMELTNECTSLNHFMKL